MAVKKDRLSDAQKAELEKLRPFIARSGLIVKMNAANWRSTLDAILGISGYSPRYRMRCVRDLQDPPESIWLGPLPEGLPLYNYIEWIELNPISVDKADYSTAIRAALQTKGISFSLTKTGIRVYGYLRTKP